MNPVIQTAQHFPNALPIFNALPVMGKLHNVHISCVFEEARESESLTMGRTAREAGGDKTREPELASLIVVNDELTNAPVIVNATRPPSDNTEDELPTFGLTGKSYMATWSRLLFVILSPLTPRVILNHEFVWACHEEGRLMEADELKIRAR